MNHALEGKIHGLWSVARVKKHALKATVTMETVASRHWGQWKKYKGLRVASGTLVFMYVFNSRLLLLVNKSLLSWRDAGNGQSARCLFHCSCIRLRW